MSETTNWWKQQWNNDKDLRMIVKVFGAFIAAFTLLYIACGLFDAYMRARAYEQVTGKHVTIGQAYWLELKVQEPVKEN